MPHTPSSTPGDDAHASAAAEERSLEPVPLLRPSAKIVQILEEVLDKAMRGEVLALAVAYQSTSGVTGYGFHIGRGDVAHLVTALERATLALLQLPLGPPDA